VGRHRVSVSLIFVFTIALTTTLAMVVRQNHLLGVERDRATSSLALLKSAFEAANPGQSAAGTTTAREVLMAAREELSAMRERRPEVYVDVGATIAVAQLALGHPDDALSLLDEILPLIDHAQPEVAADIAVLNLRTLIAAGRYEEADALLTDTGSTVVTRGRLLAIRGWLRAQQARYNEALADLEPAIALLADEPPTDPVATLARLQLGTVLRMLARPEDALALVDQTLSWQLDAGLSSAAVADTRLRRVELLRVLGRREEALAESTRALIDAERVFGDRSMVTATALNGVGNTLGSLGRYTEAEGHKRRALEICLERVGPLHPSTIRTKFNLANSLARIPAQAESAAALFEEAIAGATAVWGPRNRNTLIFRATWADLLNSRGQAEPALTLLLAPFKEGPPADASQVPRHFLQVLDRVRTRSCETGSAGSTIATLCREAEALSGTMAAPTEGTQ
jgi:serine/threonine-protein kinase